MNLTGSPDAISNAIWNTYPQAEMAVKHARSLTFGHSTKGSVYDYQANVLFALVRPYDTPGSNILEIGTYYGFTAAVMAQAAPKASIITINPLEWEAEAAHSALENYTNVQVVCTKSRYLLGVYTGRLFDFIFVDGDHKLILDDLGWWNQLNVGGTMLFHDYTPLGSVKHCPPVVQGLDAFTMYLGRPADHSIIDDQQSGMLAWVKQATDKAYIRKELARG